MDKAILHELFLGNPISKWLLSVGVLLLSLLLNQLMAKFAAKLSFRVFKKVSNAQFYDEFSKLFNKPFINIINLLAIYFACNVLTFPIEWEMAKASEFGLRWLLHALFLIAFIWSITMLFLRSADFMEFVYHNSENATVSRDLATFLKELTKVLIYIGALFVLLSKAFEVDITALITGLGIGGLAIAFAAQDTLANLIGSFIIYLDKPFQVGELIDLGDIKGTVEKIGFRTTRIRTLDRTLLIVPNKKIIDSNLNNITQSSQRRVKFFLGLTYQSDPQSILGIIEDIKGAILAENPITTAEMTVRFTDFDSSSLNLFVSYYVDSNDYETMIAIKEKINIKIMEIVKSHSCDFAYPTRTIFLEKN
ncbi:MAG: mechanosensitive ion channel family protein [bacterium]|nr:mechanosensitive ion channel family protein [bacterium]